MLTLLSVEKENRALFSLRNKIVTEIKSADGVDVKHLRYICRHGRVRWDKIAKASGAEAKRLLINENTEVPEGSGVIRFQCDELKVRLCLNMAIEVLKNAGKLAKNIKTAVYDPDGRIADGVGAMLKYTDTVTVVTSRTGLYAAEAERIMVESGAVLSISRRMKALSVAHLIVAPLQLKTQLPCEKRSVILSSMAPSVSQKSGIYYKYYFSLSEELIKLLPEGFDAEYLASALYTLCGRYDLGSIVPQATKGTGAAHTLVSLSKYLINIAENT